MYKLNIDMIGFMDYKKRKVATALMGGGEIAIGLGLLALTAGGWMFVRSEAIFKSTVSETSEMVGKLYKSLDDACKKK